MCLFIFPTTATAYSWEDINCLAENAFYEARGEGVKGMRAVIDVTLNRVESSRYPNSICKVVYQKMQFSWTHQTKQKVSKEEKDYEYVQALHLATGMLLGHGRGVTNGSLWYHEKTISPRWSKSSQMRVVKKIKSHIFYAAN